MATRRRVHRSLLHTRRNNRRDRHYGKPKPTSCALADDFYYYHNGHWVRKAFLPPTETRITQAYFIQKKVNQELHTIIESQPPASQIGLFLQSWDNYRTPSALFQSALAIHNTSDICRMMGWLIRVSIGAPLSIYTQGDERDHRVCRIWIEEGWPRIGIPEYWLWPEYAAHRRAYKIYLRRLSAILKLPIIEKAYAAEHEFAEVFPSAKQRPPPSLKAYPWSSLQSEFRRIDWPALLTAIGYSEKQQKDATYHVTSEAFLHHLQRRLVSWPLDTWRGWFACILAQWLAGTVPHGPLRRAWFAYNRTFLQGMQADLSKTELRRAIVPVVMPNVLGKLWVDRYCSNDTRRAAAAMCERIRSAAAAAIRTTDWMSPSTKAEALNKLRALRIDVGWPDKDKWMTHELSCEFAADDYVGNMLALGKATTELNIQQRDCRKPLGDNWSRPVYEVNAFYSPEENRFLLPAGILRPPFWSDSVPATTNYGSIGATIGHEICHAFDSDGRNYDANGNKRNWWTPADDREYRSKAREVQQLYESRKYRGMPVDGTLTLVENIADIGGIQFALEGLRDELGHDLTPAELREFFDSYAISWRAKDRRKRAAQLLDTDPHAPPMLRVNHVVRLFDEWYAAYGIDDSCAEWIPKEKRVRFFGPS
jgi:putative endopeptidase